MSELTRFTAKQQKDLIDNGFAGLYKIITYFPYSLKYITPFQQPEQHKEFETYMLYEDVLNSCVKRTSQRPYWLLTWQSGLKTYYFNTASYTRSILQNGERFQCLIKKSGGFATVFRLQKKHQTILQDRFVLGKADTATSYFIPKYSKTGALDSARWQTLHNRIQRNEYVLDLRGMVPKDLGIPETFDTWAIHHPFSLEKFQESLQIWKSFQVFLYMATYYSWAKKHQKHAPSTKLDQKWLNGITSTLPYDLSPTQSDAISSVLQGLSG